MPTKEQQTIYILFSIANEYDQPDKAFEKLFWQKPTLEQLKEYGFKKIHMKDLRLPNSGGNTEYWVEEFIKPI